MNASSPSLAVSQGNGGSVAGGKVTLVWDDNSSDSNNNRDDIKATGVTFNGTTLTAGATTTVSTTYVRAAKDVTGGGGGLVNPNSGSTLVSPVGIGPGAVVASDNTLGANSPFEGRLYVTYVNNIDMFGNPGAVADNTDVFLRYSTRSGAARRGAPRSALTTTTGRPTGLAKGPHRRRTPAGRSSSRRSPSTRPPARSGCRTTTPATTRPAPASPRTST